MSKFILITAAIGLLALAGATPTCAQEATTRSVTVHFTDIDLTRPAGQQQLHRRIMAAIDTVCTMPHPGSMLTVRAEDVCRATALAETMPKMAQAIAQANNPVRVASTDINVAGRQ